MKPTVEKAVTIKSVVESVAQFIRDTFEGQTYPVKPKRYGEDLEPIPLNVYAFTLAEPSDVIEKIPYAVVRFIEITDKEKSDGFENIMLLRLILVMYAKTGVEGYNLVASMIDNLRNRFLTKRYIGGVEVVEPFEAMLYEDQTEDPYYVGEISLVLKMPRLYNEFPMGWEGYAKDFLEG